MGVYVHFFRMTPEQFWDLDIEDYYGLGRYMEWWNEKQREQS